MAGAYFIGIIVMFISMAVSWRLKSKFREYSQIGLASNPRRCFTIMAFTMYG
jgi:uncharacterized protein